MGAEVPDLPAAIELGEVVAAGQLFSTNRRPSTNQQPPPVSFARRRTGEMGKREENVAAMAVRLKGLIWCTLTPKISMGTWLNMKVMPISHWYIEYNIVHAILKTYNFLCTRCLAGCARLVSTQVNNTTAIFSNISFRHQLWRLPDQLYQNMDLQMQMPYLGSSFKEKQMCRKIVSKLVSLSSGISESMTGHHAIRALLAWLCSAHHCHALHFLLSANPFWICLSSNPERTIAFS
uniref:Uncharacterized protein n=1 Tax=Oryza glumipatula TaxID=40148 RepID=A0A0E0B9I8_9ORYZ